MNYYAVVVLTVMTIGLLNYGVKGKWEEFGSTLGQLGMLSPFIGRTLGWW